MDNIEKDGLNPAGAKICREEWEASYDEILEKTEAGTSNYRRVCGWGAAVHVIFNVAGVPLWMMFFLQPAEFKGSVSRTALDLSRMARMAAETPCHIANTMLFTFIVDRFTMSVHIIHCFILFYCSCRSVCNIFSQ
jgi:hypothetical protein